MDDTKTGGPVVNPLLTDLYQIAMAQAYYKSGRHNKGATFDLYFRQAPFSGSLAVFAGMSSIISFLKAYQFTPEHIKYISTILPCEPGFLNYLQTLTATSIKIYAHKEGYLVAPDAPILRVYGPLALVQLLETPLLNLVNYASLVATNALRFRLLAPKAALYEFGLRRAQGPDGAMSASQYCYLGGFDGTSNVAAGYQFGIPVVGTHAHSFVQSFKSLADVPDLDNVLKNDQDRTIFISEFRERVITLRKELAPESSEGELAAFVAFATTYPRTFSALVDTYSTLRSGVPNFMCVALALHECGFRALGVRLDSGALASLSVQVHVLMQRLGRQYSLLGSDSGNGWEELVNSLRIMASNDITVDRIREIQSCNNRISAYGIGTHLVTCLEQPALGCVFKLSSISKSPRMKISEDSAKMSLPGEKVVYRLFSSEGYATYDAVQLASEKAPVIGDKCTFRLRSDPSKRVSVHVVRVEELLSLVWDGQSRLKTEPVFDYLQACRERLKRQTEQLQDSLRRSRTSGGYPLLLSEGLFETMERLQVEAGGTKDAG